MILVRLIYTSTVTEDFVPAEIDHILKTARANNKNRNVTGLLCFNNTFFLQCLEGSREQVNNTYQKILNDKRHTNITILSYSEIIEREFHEWSMGYMPNSSLTTPLNLKYSSTPDFNPYEMSGDSTQRLMFLLKEGMEVD